MQRTAPVVTTKHKTTEKKVTQKTQCPDVNRWQCIWTVIAVAGGSLLKQMIMNINLDLSQVNHDIWRRCWISMSYFTRSNV